MQSNPKDRLREITNDLQPLGLFLYASAEYFGLKVYPPAFEEALERIQGKGYLPRSAATDR